MKTESTPTRYPIPRRGENLPDNGAVVLEVKGYDNEADHYFLSIVLCLYGREFVVWTYNRRTGGCSGGSYHDSIVTAAKHFEAR